MQRTICKRLYDTETATLIKAHSEGNFGDPAGFEERLYRTPEGYYFLYGNGGEASPYKTETIKRVSAARVTAEFDDSEQLSR